MLPEAVSFYVELVGPSKTHLPPLVESLKGGSSRRHCLDPTSQAKVIPLENQQERPLTLQSQALKVLSHLPKGRPRSYSRSRRHEEAEKW